MSDDDDTKKQDETDKALDYLNALADAQGVAVSTIADGHLLFFKRTFLQSLLDAHPDKEKLTIFIKRPDFASSN